MIAEELIEKLEDAAEWLDFYLDEAEKVLNRPGKYPIPDAAFTNPRMVKDRIAALVRHINDETTMNNPYHSDLVDIASALEYAIDNFQRDNLMHIYEGMGDAITYIEMLLEDIT